MEIYSLMNLSEGEGLLMPSPYSKFKELRVNEGVSVMPLKNIYSQQQYSISSSL
jgi:hypothetical protein